MKKMAKTLTCALVLAILISLVAGCAGTPDNNDSRHYDWLGIRHDRGTDLR